MSFRRAYRRSVNQNTYLDNRLSTFTNPHIYEGDLHVERDETVGRNLTVGQDLNSVNFYASGNFYLNRFVLIPAGTIIMCACVAEPGGWFDCNGRQLTVSLYPALFSAINYSFGGSDLSFNIPDMRGRVGVGMGQGAGLTNRTLAATGGEETHTLTVNEIPAHTHSYVNNVGDQSTDNAFGTETAADQADYNQTTGSTGGGLAHNNMQPFVVIRHLIKY